MPLFVNPGAAGKGGSNKLRAALPTPRVGSDRRFPKTTTVSDGRTDQPLAAPLAGTVKAPPANALDAGAGPSLAPFGNSGLKSALYNLRPNRFVRGAKDKSVPKLL